MSSVGTAGAAGASAGRREGDIVLDDLTDPQFPPGVREILDALHEGRPNQLTPVPSYLDFVQEEMAHASQSSTSHEAVEIWKGFLGEPGTLPGFPLDDGLPPGSQVPQEASCIPILDAHQGAVFGDWCRANGVSSATLSVRW